MKKDTVESRALKIAAMCKKLYVDDKICEKCIRSWLLSKAHKKLKKEQEG